MKSKLITVILVFSSVTTFSQSVESLKVATKKLYEANYLMDFQAIVSLSYPKMVETVGAALLLEKIEKHYENEEYRLREQLEILPFQYGIIKKVAEKTFCVITFRNPMRYFFENKLTPEISTQKKAWLQEINATKDVTFEPIRNSFNVRKTSTYVAIADETTSNEWRFFNLDDSNQLTSFKSLIDENIRKELGL